MRIGVFGGTFDPVHLGHLVLAEQCREQGRLDQVRFVPAFRPPNKLRQDITAFDRRVEMLQLAAAGNPAFVIDELEKERPGPSYTVDTLAILQERHPGSELFLMVGSDTLADMPNWRDPVGILARAGLLVLHRPGTPVLSADELRQRLSMASDAPLRMQAVETPLVDIASRDLRQRVAQGKSVRYFVPRAVEVYISDKKLYSGNV